MLIVSLSLNAVQKGVLIFIVGELFSPVISLIFRAITASREERSSDGGNNTVCVEDLANFAYRVPLFGLFVLVNKRKNRVTFYLR